MQRKSIGRYTAGQAAKAVGLRYSVVNYWATSGFLVPSVQEADGSSSCRVYDLRDLIALRAAKELRAAGISLQALREVVEYLKNREGGYEHPLADAFLVAADDGDVLEKNGAQLVSVFRRKGQTMFAWVLNLGELVEDVKKAVLKMERPLRGKACKVA